MGAAKGKVAPALQDARLRHRPAHAGLLGAGHRGRSHGEGARLVLAVGGDRRIRPGREPGAGALPVIDTWVSGAGPADYPPIPRMYHTAAAVLAGGQVLICGSNKDSQRNSGVGRSDHEHHGQDARGLRLELYYPPYLFDAVGNPASRIEITPDAEAAGYGEPLTLRSPDAARIQRVTLLRCSSVTHGYSADQRLIELTIDGRATGEVTVTTPAHPRDRDSRLLPAVRPRR